MFLCVVLWHVHSYSTSLMFFFSFYFIFMSWFFFVFLTYAFGSKITLSAFFPFAFVYSWNYMLCFNIKRSLSSTFWPSFKNLNKKTISKRKYVDDEINKNVYSWVIKVSSFITLHGTYNLRSQYFEVNSTVPKSQ